MFRLRSLQWWTGALFATLMILVVVFAYLARKPLCIDSKLVERIDSISEKGTATAYRCSLKKRVDYNEKLSYQAKDVSRRLREVERYFDWLGPLRSRVNITIIEGLGNHYRIQDQEIYISESILKSRGQLEKAVFRVWFRQRAPLSLQTQLLMEESFTDLLYYSLVGEIAIEDPITGVSLGDVAEVKWPRVLSNMKGYCKSLWRSNDDLRACNDPAIAKPKEEIELQTLRPLLTQTMIESYQALSASERLPFLQFLSQNLSQFEFHEKNFGMSSLQPKQQNYFEAISQLENWTYFIFKIGEKSPIAQKFSVYFQNSLKRRGFDESAPKAELDTLVFAANLSQVQVQDLMNQTDYHPDQLIGVETAQSLQMNSGGEPLSLEAFGNVRATTGILFHCGIPKVTQMTALSQRVEKLIFINSCGQSQFRFDGLFSRGIVGFAHQNPKVKFAEFHLPSLLLAIQKLKGQNPIEMLTQNKKESLAPIGWSAPTYDSNIDAFRGQSAIEIVDWFRL
jgi:hypothetical protein